MSNITPRWYQSEARDALIESVRKGNHPVAALPTASGKSIVIIQVCEEYLKTSEKDILILSHTKEILKQDSNALVNYGLDNIGIYSAGIGKREVKRITVAGIQSVYRKADLFKGVGLVIIDEAHLVSPDEETMYRKLFNELDAQFMGVTATPYRLGSGFIYTGEYALFDDLCYDLTTFDAFNKLVEENYLAKLVTKKLKNNLDVSKLSMQGGDFKNSDQSKEFDKDELNEAIVDEIVESGKDRKKWLIFAVNIEHAEHLEIIFKNKGILAKCVHSQMIDDRDEVLKAHRDGVIKCLINVNVLTTGYDDPEIDLLGIIRATDSPSLHVQIVGRGMRVSPNKKDCLVMDFAGNTSRLGAINDIQICDEGFKKEEKEPPIRECPICNELLPSRLRECYCGYVFPVIERDPTKRLDVHSSNEEIFKSKKMYVGPDTERAVIDIKIERKSGYGGRPDSMMVRYFTTHGNVNEQICYDHQGYAKYMANNFVRSRLSHIANLRMPNDLDELFKASKYFKIPKIIKADTSGKYHRVLDIEWE